MNKNYYDNLFFFLIVYIFERFAWDSCSLGNVFKSLRNTVAQLNLVIHMI